MRKPHVVCAISFLAGVAVTVLAQRYNHSKEPPTEINTNTTVADLMVATNVQSHKEKEEELRSIAVHFSNWHTDSTHGKQVWMKTVIETGPKVLPYFEELLSDNNLHFFRTENLLAAAQLLPGGMARVLPHAIRRLDHRWAVGSDAEKTKLSAICLSVICQSGVEIDPSLMSIAVAGLFCPDTRDYAHSAIEAIQKHGGESELAILAMWLQVFNKNKEWDFYKKVLETQAMLTERVEQAKKLKGLNSKGE
jgi:hypothetical protein